VAVISNMGRPFDGTRRYTVSGRGSTALQSRNAMAEMSSVSSSVGERHVGSGDRSAVAEMSPVSSSAGERHVGFGGDATRGGTQPLGGPADEWW
jgi:hypothetical protein